MSLLMISNFGSAESTQGTFSVNLNMLVSGVDLFVTTAETGERDVQRLAEIR